MKMKKKVLSAAVLAAMSVGSAQAVNLSQTGTGEVMIVPYYTVQGGEETVFSIVNTTDETKAVKVRFHEPMNSREVLDFNLYLSPYDVWTAKVLDNSAGNGATIITSDKSCTVPAIDDLVSTTTEDFRPYAYNGQMADSPADGGPTGLERTREGYFEIIEMGIWANDGDGVLPWGVGAPDSTHVSGTPENCATLRASWADGGLWTINGNEDVAAPTGGLFAAAAVINVQAGTEMEVEATTLEAFSNIAQHTAPGYLTPNLSSASPAESVVMLNDGVSDGAQVYEDAWLFGEDAVTAVLQAQVVMNEYTVNPATAASTDWVVTFPTKRFYTDSQVWRGYENPFSSNFPMAGQACETVTAVYFDREEQLVTGTTDFSPLPDGATFDLCYEANVVNFEDSNVLSSELVDTSFSVAPFTSGWAAFGFIEVEHELVAPSGRTYEGLPSIGFRATKLMNANVGVGAAYGVSEQHKYERVVWGGPVPDYSEAIASGM